MLARVILSSREIFPRDEKLTFLSLTMPLMEQATMLEGELGLDQL